MLRVQGLHHGSAQDRQSAWAKNPARFRVAAKARSEPVIYFSEEIENFRLPSSYKVLHVTRIGYMKSSNSHDLWWTEKLERAQTPARLKPLALAPRTFRNDHIWLKSSGIVLLVLGACWSLKTAAGW